MRCRPPCRWASTWTTCAWRAPVFPTFGFVGVVVGDYYGPVGHGNEVGVADGEVCLFCLRLGFLHHGDVARDAL